MKKILAMVLSACMVMTPMTCAAEEAGDSITVWCNPECEEFMKKMAEEHQAETGVEVLVTGIDMVDGDYKHTIDGPAGIGPDILYGPHNDVGDKSAQGLFAPIEISEETRALINEAALDACTYEDNLYLVPDTMGTSLLIYNKDLVETPPATWDEMVEIVNDPKFDNGGDGSLGLLWSLGNCYYSAGVLFACGGYVFGNDNTDPSDIGLNNEGAVEGAGYVQQLFGMMPAGMADRNSAEDLMLGLFCEGKVGMMVNGTGVIPSIEEAGINYGIAKMFAMPNGEVVKNYSGFNGMALSGFSEKADLAIPFMEFVVQNEHAEDFFTMTGHIPTNQNFLDTKSEDNEIIKAFNEQIGYCVPMVKIPEGNQTWDPLHAAMGALASADADPQAVMDTAVEQVQDNIAAMSK